MPNPDSIPRITPNPDSVLLITGGESSLGTALVEAFAADGCAVAFSVPDLAHLSPGLLRLIESTDRVTALSCDVRSESEVVRMVHRAVHTYGRIDAVINAASTAGPRSHVMDCPYESWRNVLATNVTGTFLVCREILPWLVRQQHGSLVNVTSDLAGGTRSGWGPFVAAKSAVEGFTRVLASEVKDSGVRVNLVSLPPPSTRRDAASAAIEILAPFRFLARVPQPKVHGQTLRCAGFAEIKYAALPS